MWCIHSMAEATTGVLSSSIEKEKGLMSYLLTEHVGIPNEIS